LASRIRSRTPARTIVTTIDPDPRHADSLTWHMVVEERLGNMEKSASLPDLFDPSGKGIEIRGVRLVGADIFGGDDLIELDTESAIAGGKAVAVDIGEDDELIVLLQPSESFFRIRERRPIGHRGAQRVRFVIGDGITQGVSGATEGLAQGIGVESRSEERR